MTVRVIKINNLTLDSTLLLIQQSILPGIVFLELQVACEVCKGNFQFALKITPRMAMRPYQYMPPKPNKHLLM